MLSGSTRPLCSHAAHAASRPREPAQFSKRRVAYTLCTQFYALRARAPSALILTIVPTLSHSPTQLHLGQRGPGMLELREHVDHVSRLVVRRHVGVQHAVRHSFRARAAAAPGGSRRAGRDQCGQQGPQQVGLRAPAVAAAAVSARMREAFALRPGAPSKPGRQRAATGDCCHEDLARCQASWSAPLLARAFRAQ